jgi:hypothetical protein
MNSHLLRRSLAVAMVCLALSTSAGAQSAKVFFVDGYGYQSCAPVYQGFHQVYIQFAAAGPIGTARFKVQPSSPVTIFSPPNGEFDLTYPCAGGTGGAAVLVCIVPTGTAVTFSIVPATGHAAIEVTDCDGYDLSAVWECDGSVLLAPYRPNPPMGAVDVPTNQLLSYVGEANYVDIGTSPSLDNARVICQTGPGEVPPPCPLPLDPGLLAPHTTYYWRAHHHSHLGQVFSGHSEIFSFTTGDAPLAVESSTWGHVKALYRE